MYGTCRAVPKARFLTVYSTKVQGRPALASFLRGLDQVRVNHIFSSRDKLQAIHGRVLDTVLPSSVFRNDFPDNGVKLSLFADDTRIVCLLKSIANLTFPLFRLVTGRLV